MTCPPRVAITRRRCWPDGRVLIVGGLSTSNGLDKTDTKDPAPRSAEIYDPASGTFSPAGTLVADRLGHSASLLPDGHVLLAGGYDRTNKEHPFSSTAELYDPATGTSAATGDMTAGLAFQAAAPLPDGRVILVGLGYEALLAGVSSGSGGTDAVDLMSAAEIFHPTTGTFSAGEVDPGVMPTPCPTRKGGSCKSK